MHNGPMEPLKEEIAAVAARLVVEEGLEYGGAKRRAVKQLGLPERTALPDNALLEAHVEDYIALFCADTQPQELRELRRLALGWMDRLQRFRPYLGGAVWHGTATRRSDIYLQLFCDDSSKQIVKMLTDECDRAGVRILTSTQVHTITQSQFGYAVATSTGPLSANILVIATGGLSIPAMGASGFGYEVARQFGHTVLPTRAGLVPLTLSGRYSEQFAELSGVSLPVRASVGRTHFENAMLITHRGLSGPAILQISSYWQAGNGAPLLLNLLPAGAMELLSSAQRDQGHLTVADWLAEVLPKRFAQRFCEVYGEAIGSGTKIAECSKATLAALAKHLSTWPIIASGTEGYRTAEVTLGGVDTTEISSSTMESKRAPGLYFIGEVLDVTGHLGGYNFQMAWASGVAAGRAMAGI